MYNDTFAGEARAALFDNGDAWQILVDRDPRALMAWCTDTIMSVQGQLASRRASWEAFLATGPAPDLRAAEEERYLGWRSRANRLRIKCETRKRDLRPIVQDIRRNDRADMYKQVLFTLAAAVDDHEKEKITRADLCGILDQLEVPTGADGTKLLMDAVDAWRDHHAAVAAEQAA